MAWKICCVVQRGVLPLNDGPTDLASFGGGLFAKKNRFSLVVV
jgi:hypothetical protein